MERLCFKINLFSISFSFTISFRLFITLLDEFWSGNYDPVIYPPDQTASSLLEQLEKFLEESTADVPTDDSSTCAMGQEVI